MLVKNIWSYYLNNFTIVLLLYFICQKITKISILIAKNEECVFLSGQHGK